MKIFREPGGVGPGAGWGREPGGAASRVGPRAGWGREPRAASREPRAGWGREPGGAASREPRAASRVGPRAGQAREPGRAASRAGPRAGWGREPGGAASAPPVTIGLADIGDKFVVSAFHAKPRKDRTTDNLVIFVMDVDNLATLIADKIGKIVTIQAKVITLQFVIEGIDGMTLRSVISVRTVAAATTGKSVTNRMIPLDRFNRCNRHFLPLRVIVSRFSFQFKYKAPLQEVK